MMKINKRTVTGVAAIGAAVLSLTVPLIETWEGLRTRPYKDPVGISTVCYGETRVKMRPYTPQECREMLNRAITQTYGPQVLACTPAIGDYPGAFAAAISLAYNIGPAAYCKSTAAKRFQAGDLKGGCKAFAMWVKAGGRVLPGLVNRREAEIELCHAAV